MSIKQNLSSKRRPSVEGLTVAGAGNRAGAKPFAERRDPARGQIRRLAARAGAKLATGTRPRTAGMPPRTAGIPPRNHGCAPGPTQFNAPSKETRPGTFS